MGEIGKQTKVATGKLRHAGFASVVGKGSDSGDWSRGSWAHQAVVAREELSIAGL